MLFFGSYVAFGRLEGSLLRSGSRLIISLTCFSSSSYKDRDQYG